MVSSHPPSKAPILRDPNRVQDIRLVPPPPPWRRVDASAKAATPAPVTKPPALSRSAKAEAAPVTKPPAQSPLPSARYPCVRCGGEIPQGQVTTLQSRAIHPRLWKCIPCTHIAESRLRDQLRNAVGREVEMPADRPCAGLGPLRPNRNVHKARPRSAAPTPAAASPRQQQQPAPSAPSSSTAPQGNTAAAAAASADPLALFLAGRQEAILKMQAKVTKLAVDKFEAERKLADLETRFASATSEGGPAAEMVQVAQVRAGLIAARKSALALVSQQLLQAREAAMDIERQHSLYANASISGLEVAKCDNCLADIAPSELLACRPGPRSDALLHCPKCAVDPNLH